MSVPQDAHVLTRERQVWTPAAHPSARGSGSSSLPAGNSGCGQLLGSQPLSSRPPWFFQVFEQETACVIAHANPIGGLLGAAHLAGEWAWGWSQDTRCCARPNF